ncbi:MAG: hydrogenase expression/formation C-terminal domain-containing protein [Dakarella massiliensis]
MSELNAAAKDVDFDHFDPTMVPVAVELTRQPLSPNDKDYINKVLGEGTIEVQMQGFAKITIRGQTLWG